MMSNTEVRALLKELTNSTRPLKRPDMRKKTKLLRCGVFGPDFNDMLFPVKLHILVSHQEIPEVFWVDDGTAFAIDREGFKMRIMSIFFSQHTFKSFQNILSAYRFRGVFTASPNQSTSGKDVYKHSLFLRNQKALSKNITQSKRKGKRSTCQEPSSVLYQDSENRMCAPFQKRRMLDRAETTMCVYSEPNGVPHQEARDENLVLCSNRIFECDSLVTSMSESYLLGILERAETHMFVCLAQEARDEYLALYSPNRIFEFDANSLLLNEEGSTSQGEDSFEIVDTNMSDASSAYEDVFDYEPYFGFLPPS